MYIFVPKACPVKMHVFRFANIIYPDLLVANLALMLNWEKQM